MNVQCTATALIIRSIPVIDPGSDLNKRFMKDQIATVYGQSLDGQWLYVDAPAARGWVSKTFTTEPKVVALSTPSWPRVPHGLDEIKKLFGEPGKPICQAGRIKLPKELKLSWSSEKIAVFACHKLIEDVLQSVFKTINDKGYWDLIETYGGCYEFRNTRGASHYSCHAWGIAIDINPGSNPLGQKPKMPQQLITIFKDHGFFWGGDFSGRTDGMHFQYAVGY